MTKHYINTDNLSKVIHTVKAGDQVFLSGTVYTARDSAHKRLFEYIDRGEDLPFDVKGKCIYYAGPTATPPGSVIGSCGPTTSTRMDKFSPKLLDMGLLCMIGKGERSPDVIEAIVRNKALYLSAVGGAGAYIAHSVTSVEVVLFDDLGCESIKKLTVNNMPTFCAIDSYGNNIFDKGEK